MLPTTLALIDDDVDFSEYLSQYLGERGINATWFSDSDELLCSRRPFAFDFYVVDLMLPGIDGLSLLRVLRKASQAGILVVSGKLCPDVFAQVIGAGADMYLAKPVTVEQITLAIGGVYRRSAASQQPQQSWQLDEVNSVLLAPDGAKIELSNTDVQVLTCLM